MRTEAKLEDFESIISALVEVIGNIEKCRDALSKSELDEVLVHINTFNMISGRLILGSQRMIAEVEHQINEFSMGIESKHLKSRDKYARYYQHQHKSKRKKPNAEENQ